MDLEKLLELLSDYFDEELEPEICAEIHKTANQDSCCRTLFNTFGKTLELLNELNEEEIEVPETTHVALYEYLRIEIKKKSI